MNTDSITSQINGSAENFPSDFQTKTIGDLLFLSELMPTNPETYEVEANDIEGQTRQILENIKTILTQIGITFNDVLKITCFLTDMQFAETFNEIYEETFLLKPACSIHVVKELPKKTLIKIELIANISEKENNSFNFDKVLDRSELSTVKWEYEIKRTNNPNLLCYGTADMDFQSAPQIIRALTTVARNGHFGYPLKKESYYNAIIQYFQKHYNWNISKESIASSSSVYPSFQSIIEGLTNEGDEIIINTPVHNIFNQIITATNRATIENPLKKLDGEYYFDLEDLKEKITDKTSMLILCNPQNPIGRIWTKEELSELMDICLENEIIVLSDEIYFGLPFPGECYTPIASISEKAAMNTITCFSGSKSFNLTGIKHSIVVSKNSDFLNKYNQELQKNQLGFGSSIFGLSATEVAFSECDEWSEALMEYIKKNHEFVVDFIKKYIPNANVYRSKSAYFAWIDFNYLNISNKELVDLFENKAEINVVYGFVLGTGGKGYVRWNIGCPRSTLQEGLERLERALNQ